MIVDASAIIAVLVGEEDDERMLRQLLRHAGNLRMSPVNWFETWNRVRRSDSPHLLEPLTLLYRQCPVELIACDEVQALTAKEAMFTYGRGSRHPAKLNMGDCFAYALAKTRDEPLLFKGNDFVHTDIRSAL